METRQTETSEKLHDSPVHQTREKKHRIGHAFSSITHAYRQRWFQVLATGVLFIALMEVSYLIYPNANLIPAMIVYSAFLVPVTLMVHLYERLHARELPLAVIMLSFICAGAVGIVIASTLELALLKPLGHFEFFGVGLIEESSKMVIPLALFALGTYRSVGAGVMIGLVSAMAFSSLETSGYIFKAFLGDQSGEASGQVAALFKNPANIAHLDVTAISRSLMDPIGHGTWTMLVCFALFNERRKAGRFVLNGRVLLAFVLAILLHAAWDTSLFSMSWSPVWGKVLEGIAFFVTFFFVVWLMKRIIRRTREVMETIKDVPVPDSKELRNDLVTP